MPATLSVSPHSCNGAAHRRLLLALCGAFLGCAAFFLIHTGASLNVTNDAWILSGYVEKDIIQHYTGWLFYRSAPLSFPLGVTTAIQYPSGTALTFTDSIPLFGIFFRLLGSALPATFQYFGWFTLLCYGCMGAAAALLLALFLPRNLPVLLGTGLFVTYPILVERTFRHTALAAQCLILFALYLYFKDKCEGFRFRGGWLVLTALAATIHPYFVPMIFALLFADLLEHCAAVRSLRTLGKSALFLLCNFTATLAAMACIGAFSSPASEGISGYSYFCMNLNALYNPVSRGSAADIIWSRFLPALAQGEGTYEGFNYMGLGVLAFGAAGAAFWLCRHAKTRLLPLCKRYFGLLLVCACLIVFAVSNVLVLNGEILCSVPIPGFVSHLANTFRASGRMFWPVNYLVLLCTVVFWARRGASATEPVCASATRKAEAPPHASAANNAGCGTAGSTPHATRRALLLRSAGTVCVALLLAVQLWDISPALAEKRAAFTNPQAEFENPMQSAAWNAMAGRFTHLFSLDDTLVQALYPALWAAQNGMTTNDGFAARFDFAAHRADVAAETARLLAGTVQDDTLYLTCDYARFAEIADALRAADANVTCAQLDGIWYAIIPNAPNGTALALPAADDRFWIYPDFPLMLAPLTDAVWTNGVLNSDQRVCIFYAGQTAANAFDTETQLVCGGQAYDILGVDTGDAGWVMVTLDLADASVLGGKILSTR